MWILGAGFSRALGGPLLEDLFRMEPLNQISAQFPVGRFSGLAADLYRAKVLFNHGKEHRYWDNAEVFLAAAENAFLEVGPDADREDVDRQREFLFARADAAWAHSGRETGEELHQFRRVMQERGNLMVRRALAAECSRFCYGPHSEIWEPYKRWLDSLQPELDALVSFNYDCVVEIADILRLEEKGTAETRVSGRS